MIGKENIEEKIFEYFEGELTSSESKELENFIQSNPEYQADFDAWKQSSVPNEPMEYKFADELLVNEKSSPKGWFTWASGGAMLFLVSLASVTFFNKYDGGADKVASLKEQLDKVGDVALGDIVNTSPVKNNEEVSSLDLDQQIISNSVIETEKNQSKSNTQVETNNKKSNFSEIKPSLASDKVMSDDFSVKSSVSDVVTDKKTVVSHQSEFERIQVNALKGSSYEFYLPASLRKDKSSYENPNKPNFFITNNKDPYLNYSLAHTLEENGSFAGNGGEGIRAEMLYRTEWPTVTSDNFSSQIFSVDGYVKSIKGGLGVIVNADRLAHGKLNSTAVSMIYSPKIIVKGISIEPSVKYTYNEKSISWAQVDANDVKDPRNGVLYASVPFVPEDFAKSDIHHHDLGLGLLLNASKFFIGAQIDHINKYSYKEEFFDQTITIPNKISAMVGTDVYKEQGGKFSFSPSVNYVKFGNYNALWANTQFGYKGFFLATGIATNEEIMTSIGYGNNKVRLVYGLGFTKPSEFSGLTVSDKYYESHQVSLRVNLQPKKK